MYTYVFVVQLLKRQIYATYIQCIYLISGECCCCFCKISELLSANGGEYESKSVANLRLIMHYGDVLQCSSNILLLSQS